MPIQGTYRKLYPRFKFQVKVNGFLSAAFQKASGLKVTFGEMKYSEGGAVVSYKEPGLMEFEDCTLERGVSKDVDFYNWILDVTNVMKKLPGGTGMVSPNFFRDLSVWQMDRDDKAAIIWNLFWGFPKEWAPGEFDNTSNDPTIETLVVAYHHHQRLTV